jgi:hypothetical protein
MMAHGLNPYKDIEIMIRVKDNTFTPNYVPDLDMTRTIWLDFNDYLHIMQNRTSWQNVERLVGMWHSLLNHNSVVKRIRIPRPPTMPPHQERLLAEALALIADIVQRDAAAAAAAAAAEPVPEVLPTEPVAPEAEPVREVQPRSKVKRSRTVTPSMWLGIGDGDGNSASTTAAASRHTDSSSSSTTTAAHGCHIIDDGEESQLPP